MKAYSQTWADVIFSAHDLPVPKVEHKFHMSRKWRFDFAWLQQKLALEIQGGLWTGGRHVRGAALLAEHEKLNNACILGWRVMFGTPESLDKGDIFPLIRKAL